MKYFTINELTKSREANKAGIDNTPPKSAVKALTKLVDEVLDPVREAWGEPIIVNSGYRCERLNTLVGGVEDSQHLKGEAADITTGDRMGNKELFGFIKLLASDNVIEFDQLIDESGFSWIHVSYRAGKNRGQVLKL
jgi:hypothetical protein